MNEQMTLLSRTPASRAGDPSSSHDAEAEINRTGQRASQQHRVLAAVRRYPGRTSAELARLTGMDRHMVAKRLPELEPLHVQRGDKRQCAANHRPALTWSPIEKNGTG